VILEKAIREFGEQHEFTSEVQDDVKERIKNQKPKFKRAKKKDMI